MRPEGLVGPLGFPAQQDFAVALFDCKAVKDRQDATDVTADQIESMRIFLFQAVQYGCQVAAVTAKMVVVACVTELFEVRVTGCVVKLKGSAVSEKMHDSPCSCRIMRRTERTPVRGGVGYLASP